MDSNIVLANEVKDIELSAGMPSEMVLAQQQLVDWCDAKIKSVKTQWLELKESYEHAVKNKWKSGVLKKHTDLSAKRLVYYKKIREALFNGYYIVPNFRIDLFAIRTERETPKNIPMSYYATHEQDSQELPVNEGEYKNPFPLLKRKTHIKTDGKEEKYSVVDGWDEIDFPITMAKPFIMEATSRAMALKIFDEIGVIPHERKEDPIIIGRIFIKERQYKTKRVSFMIAWHLNTNVI